MTRLIISNVNFKTIAFLITTNIAVLIIATIIFIPIVIVMMMMITSSLSLTGEQGSSWRLPCSFLLSCVAFWSSGSSWFLWKFVFLWNVLSYSPGCQILIIWTFLIFIIMLIFLMRRMIIMMMWSSKKRTSREMRNCVFSTFVWQEFLKASVLFPTLLGVIFWSSGSFSFWSSC